jgi:hypothetical protein
MNPLAKEANPYNFQPVTGNPADDTDLRFSGNS